MEIYIPHVLGNQFDLLDNGVTLGGARRHCSDILGVDFSKTLLFVYEDENIELLPFRLDGLPIQDLRSSPYIIFASPSEHQQDQSVIDAMWENRMSQRNYAVVVQDLHDERIFNVSVAPGDRVSDLYSRIHTQYTLATGERPGRFQLRTLLPNLPLLVDQRSLVRDLIPHQETIYLAFPCREATVLPRQCGIAASDNGQPNMENTNSGLADSDSESGAEENTRRFARFHRLKQFGTKTRDKVPVLEGTGGPPVSEGIRGPPVQANQKRTRGASQSSLNRSTGESTRRSKRLCRNTSHRSASSLLLHQQPRDEETDTRDEAAEEESEISVITDDSLVSECCCNCQRTASPKAWQLPSEVLLHYEPRIILVDMARDLRTANRRRFLHINGTRYPVQGGNRPCRICAECYAFLSSGAENPIPSSLVWPSFVWSTLTNHHSFSRAWEMLPRQWKLWWLRSCSLHHQVSPESLMNADSSFAEFTQATELDLKAWQSLKWAEDILPRELSLVLPEVKCPAGCAEFKHKANNLPLDVVWTHLLQADIDVYSPVPKHRCTSWFRDDYLVQDILLWNPQWKCKPSIAYCKTTMSPVVLCCRHHKVGCSAQFLHPCRHPTGTIATEKASQFSPVTPVPRTLKKSQYSAYSASFRIVKMEGSFHGLDTMFLTADGGYFDYQSILAWNQERAAVINRKDLRAHIARLTLQKKLSPHTAARLTSTDSQDTSSLAAITKGANYITIGDATRLQHNFFYGRQDTTRVPMGQSDTPGVAGSRMVVFKGKWPRHLTNIHPAGSLFGAKPIMPPTFKTNMGRSSVDARAAWIVSAMVLNVQEIWESTTAAYKDFRSWEGWLLAFLTVRCLPHLHFKGHNCPFKVLPQETLFKKYLQLDYNRGFDPEAVYNKFYSGPPHRRQQSQLPRTAGHQLRNYSHISCQWNVFSPPIHGETTITIVVNRVTTPRTTSQNVPRILSVAPEGWELRLVALSQKSNPQDKPNKWYGTVYCRHGGREHPCWWRLRSNSKTAVKTPDGFSFKDIRANSTKWNVCVFVRKIPFIGNTIRNQILTACGGQHKLVCRDHNFPLILTRKDTGLVCCHQTAQNSDSMAACEAICKYTCPTQNCKVSICKSHASLLGMHATSSLLSPLPALTYQQVVEKRNTNNGASPFQLDDDENDEIEHSDGNGCFLGASCRQGFDDFGSAPSLLDSQSYDMMAGDQPPIDIPTTDTRQRPIFSLIANQQLANAKMTNHALLNCYGSCLVRRNRRLSGTLSQRSFLQRLVATNTGASIPLIYPEAMLFTDIFYADTEEGSILGALPAALLHGDGILRQHGLATLQETFCCRLMSPGLLSSSNPKYHFWAFDALANFGLRGCDSRIVLRRGFADMQGKGGVRLRGVKEPIFDSDHAECRNLVNMISAKCGLDMSTYFYTHTLSMRTHVGIRKVWEWLTGDDIVKLHCPEVTEKEIEHWRKSLIDSAGVMLLRMWMELVELWLQYIVKSPEHPMGVIIEYLARLELQKAFEEILQIISKGNLPHMHCLFWTKDDLQTLQGLRAACDRIRGFVADIVRPHEEKSYIERGIFTSHEEVDAFKATMQRFLDHKHQRRCFVLKKCPTSGQHVLHKVCKVSHNWKATSASGEHVFKSINPQHTQEAIRVMIDIGVAKTTGSLDDDATLEFIPNIDFLQSDKHIPPCQGQDGIMSPVIGVLVAINPNSDNCQLANTYFVARYLTKYVIKIDQYLNFNLAPSSSDNKPQAHDFTVTGEELFNTKITSNAIAQKEKLDRGHFPKVKNSLGINACDVYMKILGYPTILTNLRFVRYATETYECRAARYRKSRPIEKILRSDPTLQGSALTPFNTVPAHYARKVNPLTPRWRQFTEGQVQKAFDDLHSPLCADPVTVFCRRCPELHFVQHQKFYFRWFVHETAMYTHALPSGRTVLRPVQTLAQQFDYCSANFSTNVYLEYTQWVSTSTEVIRLRAAAIGEIMDYIDGAPDEIFASTITPKASALQAAPAIKREIRRLFTTLRRVVDWCVRGIEPQDIIPFGDQVKQRYRSLFSKFITESEHHRLPTPWTTPVRPRQSIRFLIHLLFSFGCFVDEYTLFRSGSLRQAFIAARLLDDSSPFTAALSAKRLLHKYFVFELKALPVGTPTFDRYCVAANHIIRSFFTANSFYSDEVPSVLYNRLQKQTTDAVVSFAMRRRKVIVDTLIGKLSDCGIASLPLPQMLVNATLENPLAWDITQIPKPHGQSAESFVEQQEIWKVAKARIDSFVDMTCSCPQSLCFVGGGGVGKTTTAMLVLLYACSRGLKINATALVSERAQELGVPHFNSDFCVPRANLEHMSAGQLAERTISSLYRNPERFEFHRTIDVELVDEMGPIAAEIWTARDIALRYIRHSTKPNGGKLDIVTFDHLQTHPVQGTHPLLSPFLCSTYSFHRLTETVRTSCPYWRRLQEITRLSQSELSSPLVRDEFVTLLTTHCTFVPTEASAPPGSLFVYGRNAPIRTRQKEMEKSLLKRPRGTVVISQSNDYESTFEGRFVAASRHTISFLDRAIREPSQLFLFKGGRYRITYNKPGVFSNGQLAFLHSLPTADVVARKEPLMFLLAPAGSSYIPDESDTEQALICKGWTIQKIGVAPDNIVQIGQIRGKRTRQYGLQMFVGSTWHSTMGKTLVKLATKISLIPSSRADPYSIWDPTQVVIMLSRTRLPANTTFVTNDPEATALAIYRVLQRPSPFRQYLSYLVDRLCSQDSHMPIPSIDQSHSIFKPRDVLLPADNTGFVYILVCKAGNVTYIGSCFNLLLRYEQHNTGFGAQQTTNPLLRPWSILAYICGFQGNQSMFQQLENQWIAEKITKLRVNRGNMTVEDIVGIGAALSGRYNRDKGLSLKFVHAGTLVVPNAFDTGCQLSSDSDTQNARDTEYESALASDSDIPDTSSHHTPSSGTVHGSASESEDDSADTADSDSDASDGIDSDASSHGRQDGLPSSDSSDALSSPDYSHSFESDDGSEGDLQNLDWD